MRTPSDDEEMCCVLSLNARCRSGRSHMAFANESLRQHKIPRFIDCVFLAPELNCAWGP